MNAPWHVALNCINPRRQESFYSRRFGFKRARVFNPPTPGEFVMLRLGGVCIEILPFPAQSSHSSHPSHSSHSSDPPRFVVPADLRLSASRKIPSKTF